MVKRYTIYHKGTGYIATEKYYCNGGDHVSYEDYAALLELCDELAVCVQRFQDKEYLPFRPDNPTRDFLRCDDALAKYDAFKEQG